MSIVLPVLLVFVAGFMYLQIRRQKKTVSATQEMQDNLQSGARVQTSSGMYATVVGLDDGVVDLELAPGVVTRWNRLAVREVVHPEDVAGSYAGAVSGEADEQGTPGGVIDTEVVDGSDAASIVEPEQHEQR